jgi:Galactose oxidase, central domain/Kelch motif
MVATLENTGGAAVNGAIPNASSPYIVIAVSSASGVNDGAGGFTLLPGQRGTITIAFAPIAAGSFRSTLIISSDAKKGGTLKLKLRGKAGTPIVTGKAGNVLIFGGTNTGPPLLAEIYDTANNIFEPIPNFTTTPRVDHADALLQDGRVLLTGGMQDDGVYSSTQSSAEIFDPATMTFTATGSMEVARQDHTATLIEGCGCPADGKVLITGGDDQTDTALASAELFDPTTGTFTPTGNMTTPRESHTATLLTTGPLAGEVLVVGGYNAGHTSTQASAELYDPVTGVFTATGSMNASRQDHTATLLPNGEVLITGGFSGSQFPVASGGFLSSAELFDPATQTFSYTGSMLNGREDASAVLIQGCNCSEDGMVLIQGGQQDFTVLQEAELYDPSSGGFSMAATPTSGREDHTATMLANGKVLVVGGTYTVTGNALNSSEIYDPATNSFTAGPNLTNARAGHTATLLQ